MKLSYNERTGQLTEKSMSGNLWQSSKLKQGANVIVATPGQLVHYMKSYVIRKGSMTHGPCIFCSNYFSEHFEPLIVLRNFKHFVLTKVTSY